MNVVVFDRQPAFTHRSQTAAICSTKGSVSLKVN